eukprot:8666337-Alexandrium_andersonii.AAC.1
MSASLVGSEMCIRDSPCAGPRHQTNELSAVRYLARPRSGEAKQVWPADGICFLRAPRPPTMWTR